VTLTQRTARGHHHWQTCSHCVPRVFGSASNDSRKVAKRDAAMSGLAYRWLACGSTGREVTAHAGVRCPLIEEAVAEVETVPRRLSQRSEAPPVQ